MRTQSPERNGAWEVESDIRPITPDEFQELRQIAHRAFGLDLKSGKEQMAAARLRRLMREGGFRSYRDYCRHVSADRTGQALAALIDALATNHTAFLREPGHFEFLRQRVLPQWARRQPAEIWCAACATGEEVWTLAFLMNDALAPGQVQITASDISGKALTVAQQAEYPAERIAGLPAAWKQRYLARAGSAPARWRVVPEVRRQVRFRRANLLDAPPWSQRFPAIFCRNVMIYFDQATQQRAVAHLAACLEPGGYLFVGHAESLSRVAHGLEYAGPAVYRKPGKGEGKWTSSW